MTDKVVRLSPLSTPKRPNESAQNPRGPALVEHNRLYSSADRYALGALGLGLLTGASAIVAMPSAYLLVSNPIVRAVVYTVPVLVPAMVTTCFGVRALQEGRAARSLEHAHAKADMEDVEELAVMATADPLEEHASPQSGDDDIV